MKRWLLGALVCGMLHTPQVHAQGDKNKNKDKDANRYIREHYAKASYKIKMRDGVHLYTIVYSPKDQSQNYPILLNRTPYSIAPYEEDKYRNSIGPNTHFPSEGYIFAYQDVRGRFMSEGEFENMRPHRPVHNGPDDIDESTDTYDTIDWLVKNVENNNGKVGMWGTSYPGFYCSAGMINAHPALKAVSPQAPIADWFFDDFYHNGAFFLPHAFNFFSRFGHPRPMPTTERTKSFSHGTPDGYQFFLNLGPLKNVNPKYFKNEIAFWNQLAEHVTYDDFWKARNILPHLKKVAPAVMTVGGWFDAEDLYGTFNTYRALEKQNPGIFNVTVVGPWGHGGWERDGTKLGNIHFGSNTAAFFQKEIELPFFNHFLKGKGKHGLPEAYVFETGANRWHKLPKWPPQNVNKQVLSFQAPGRLSFDANQVSETAYDEFVSDPRKPVPFTEQITTGMSYEYMTDDQRFASRRPDVLTYQTSALQADMTLAGPMRAELTVSTTATDADWIVKVIDVFPDDYKDSTGKNLGGYQMHVRSEVIRGRFRKSFSKPEPFKPSEPAQVSFALHDVLHTFRKGHRLMVQVHSTWFPLVDRNPQKYVPNIFQAEESDFTPATHRVYRSSRLVVGVWPREE